MAATFTWKEYNGVSGTESTATNLNFGSIDQANIASPIDYPIVAGENSYEKYIRGALTGTFTKVDNVKIYLSSGTLPTDDHLYYNGQKTTYVQPVSTDSVIAITDIPTSEPGTANVSIGGSLSGELTAPGTTDYIVLQLNSDEDQSAGAKGPFVVTIKYDEY
jgi:hypothetical protein